MNNIEFSCEKPHYEDFGYDSKEDCCKGMREYGYTGVLGCGPLLHPLEDEKLKEKSNLIYKTLSRQNKYIPFTLKKIKTIDRTGWCQHKGWHQGINNSDCFLDSVLFSIFGNDTTVTSLVELLDNLYHQSEEEEMTEKSLILSKIAYCISIYTEYLAKARPLNKTQLVTSDITILFDGREEVYNFKQSIKWCLLWFLCLYIKEYEKDLYNDLVVNGLAQSIKIIRLDFDGANPNHVLHAFSLIFKGKIKIDWHDPSQYILHEQSALDYPDNRVNKLKRVSIATMELINTKLSNDKYKEGDIIVMPFSGSINITRPFENFFTPKLGSLEAAIISTYSHVTAMTHCNKYWLLYNNLETTTHLSDGLNTKTKILEELRESGRKFTTLIFVKKSPLSFGGGVKKLSSKKIKKNKKRSSKTKRKKKY